MTIEMSNSDLIASLHTSIQQLQQRYPDRWKLMLEAIATDPDGDFAELAKRQTTAQAQSTVYTPERLHQIAVDTLRGR